MKRQFVLIGGGQTSASAARTLRRRGFDGSIVIVGDEPHPPYQRPALSKEYLQGRASMDEIWAAAPNWYSQNDVQLEIGARVVRVDRASLDVVLRDERRLRADAVLIATGGTPRQFPDAEGESILSLRTLEDARRIREHARPGRHIIVIGGGFIGSEIAASARTLGADVTMLEGLQAPLERVLGAMVGGVLGEIHREQGVVVRCGVMVDAIAQTPGGGVLVETRDGARIEGDIAVVGIGISPNVDVARATEITVGNGIRVDEFCRTTALNIYAAGDVANHYHPLFDRRMRVEHFDNATRQGAAAALNMLGERVRYDDPHWFWSDQYDHSLQYAGHAERWDEVAVRGSLAARDFVAFFLLEGRLAGVFGLNRGAEVMLAKELLAGRVVVDSDELCDEDFDLSTLLAQEEVSADDAAEGGEAAASAGNFHRAARSGQVREGSVRRFVVQGAELAIARLNGKAYALHNLCTHLACHLSSGKVENNGLTCLCHGSIFDLASGEPINPPATRPVKTYPVREIDGHIYVAVE
jgi:3-phenylpropionate/trans-cinnamate dioxygenase ferredoxin reductase component